VWKMHFFHTFCIKVTSAPVHPHSSWCKFVMDIYSGTTHQRYSIEHPYSCSSYHCCCHQEHEKQTTYLDQLANLEGPRAALYLAIHLCGVWLLKIAGYISSSSLHFRFLHQKWLCKNQLETALTSTLKFTRQHRKTEICKAQAAISKGFQF